MYIKGETLKKVSETVFHENNDTPDSGRPLEWRRSFKPIRARLRNMRIITSFTVNEVDRFHSLFERQNDEPEAEGKASTAVAVQGELDKDDFRDRILFAVETEKGSGVFTLEAPKGRTVVTIKGSDPTTSKDGSYRNVYPGNIGRSDFGPGDDGIFIEVTTPRESVEHVAQLLRATPEAPFTVNVELRAFTYEVDDALREWYHSRDLFISDGMDIALLTTIQISTREEPPEVPATDTQPYGLGEQPAPSETSPEMVLVASSVGAITRALRGLKVAVYVAATLIVVALLLTN